jgi:hypothetical protein
MTGPPFDGVSQDKHCRAEKVASKVGIFTNEGVNEFKTRRQTRNHSELIPKKLLFLQDPPHPIQRVTGRPGKMFP